MRFVSEDYSGYFRRSLAALEAKSADPPSIRRMLSERVSTALTASAIDALLDLPFQVPVPEAKALLLITNGSSGIVTGLLQAEGKPQDGPGAYAGGIVLVAGGSVPRVLIELLSAGIRSAGD